MRGPQTPQAVILPAPVSGPHIARRVLWVLRPENGEVSRWDWTAGRGGEGPWGQGLPLWVRKQMIATRKPFLIPAPTDQSPRFKCLRPTQSPGLFLIWELDFISQIL